MKRSSHIGFVGLDISSHRPYQNQKEIPPPEGLLQIITQRSF
ncbi:MAG: hypothetical protein ACOC44_10985 [Promethearchaeia archaeon]